MKYFCFVEAVFCFLLIFIVSSVNLVIYIYFSRTRAVGYQKFQLQVFPILKETLNQYSTNACFFIQWIGLHENQLISSPCPDKVLSLGTATDWATSHTFSHVSHTSLHRQRVTTPYSSPSPGQFVNLPTSNCDCLPHTYWILDISST